MVYAGPTETWYPTQLGLAYLDTQAQEDSDSSATSSDSGTAQLPEPAVSGMSSADAAHHTYMQMRAAERTWRRFTGRPVRKFRFFEASKGRGKGKGKRGSSQAFMWPQEQVTSFLSSKGKGGSSHSSGKGFRSQEEPEGQERSNHDLSLIHI